MNKQIKDGLEVTSKQITEFYEKLFQEFNISKFLKEWQEEDYLYGQIFIECVFKKNNNEIQIYGNK